MHYLKFFFYLGVFVGAFNFTPIYSQKPNVLFIAIDDLNSCLNGMEGEITIPTPNIDRLIKKGMLFTNAHCAAPACGPSRASVMTGIAPFNSGVYKNTQDWRVNTVLKEKITLPQHFRDEGYKTLGGGKIYHAASLSPRSYTGLIDARPWDEYFPSKNKQMPDEVQPKQKIPVNGDGHYGGRFDWAQLDIEPEEMADAKVVSWAEKNLKTKHKKPLFLAVGIYRPHIPWWTPKKYFDKHPIENVKLPEIVANDLDDVPEAGQKMARRTWQKWMVDNNKWKEAVQAYSASVSFADEMVGRLLTALENGPLAKNTVIVLWSDHGYHLGQKEHWEKFALWEQTTRVPLIIASPQKYNAGKICNEPVSLLDIYPTLNKLCNVPFAEKLDGTNLVPLLKNPKKKTGRSVICTQGYNNHAVRSKKWRYIRYANGSEELYDQVNDPKNFKNLANNDQYSAIKEKMIENLPQYNAKKDPTENYKQKYRRKNKK